VICGCMLEISETSTSRLWHLQALPQTITVQGRIRATGAAVSLPEERGTHTRISSDSEKRGNPSTNVGLLPGPTVWRLRLTKHEQPDCRFSKTLPSNILSMACRLRRSSSQAFSKP